MFYAINLQNIAHIHKQLIAFFSANAISYSKTSTDVFAQSDVQTVCVVAYWRDFFPSLIFTKFIAGSTPE